MKKVIFDYSKLKGRIKEKFGTYSELTTHLDYSESSLSMKLNNRSNFSQPDMLELAKVLEIPDEEFSLYFFTVKVRKVEQEI